MSDNKNETLKNEGHIINLSPNVIEGDELNALFGRIFSDMAYFVSKTYGPFGANTGYQEMDKILTTKDGWTVEQGIIYSNNTLANIIRKFIIEVSRSINVHAGDGTTTGVIAANEINKLIMEYKQNYRIHSKFLSAAIKYCVESICNEISNSAAKITDENMEDIIYRIAEVSLDWDKEFAGYIRDIYANTHNPVIRVQDSGYERSFVEYRDGYDISAKLLSEFKTDGVGVKKYTVNEPIIMVFSYTIGADMFEPLLTAALYFATTLHRELVVIAPDFEKNFRDSYNAICIRSIRAKQPVIPLTMVRYFAEYNIEREMLNDFCFLTGANIISKDYNEASTLIVDFNRVQKMNPPERTSYPEGDDGEAAFMHDQADFNQKLTSITNSFWDNISEYIGTCDKLVIDDKMLVASGFGDLEESEAIEQRKDAIRAELNKNLKDMTAKSMFTDEVKLKKLRLGKLQLKMGIINVGGFGEYNLKATRDALDDAINACSNAYLDGVVTGGGVTIPVTINTLLSRLEDGSWKPEEEKGISTSLVRDILLIIKEGFINTWEIMLKNRYTDGVVGEVTDETLRGLTTRQLIEACILAKTPWNLITETLDETIIHPARVEIEVVKGCLHLVLTTTTINQLLYNGYEGMDQELEGMREAKEV